MPLNIYQFIHKTIRGQIAHLLIQAGKTMWHNADDVRRLSASFEALEQFLKNHASREDTFVHPLLKEKQFPGMDVLEAEHSNSANQSAELTQCLQKRLIAAEDPAVGTDVQEAEGYRFYLLFADFAAFYLAHMGYEEQVIMPFLWSVSDPSDIVAVFMGMQSTLTHDELIRTIPLMYPYLNRDEAVKLTTLLCQENNFNDMIPLIRQSLDGAQCDDIFNLAGVEAVDAV